MTPTSAPEPGDPSIWRRPDPASGGAPTSSTPAPAASPDPVAAPAAHRTVVIDTTPAPARSRGTVPLREVIGLGPRRPVAAWVRRLGSISGVVATLGVVVAAALVVRSVAFPEENEAADAVWITEPTRLEPTPTTQPPESATETSGEAAPDTTVPAVATDAATVLAGAPDGAGATTPAAPATSSGRPSAPAPTATTPSGSAGVGSPGAGPGPAAPATVAPASTAPSAPPTTAPAAPAPTSVPISPAPTAPPPTAPATTAPAPSGPISAASVGGSVRASCSSGAAVVLSVTPNPGFEADQNHNGDRVEVRFRSDTHDSRVRIACDAGGAPSATVTEEGDASPG